MATTNDFWANRNARLANGTAAQQIADAQAGQGGTAVTDMYAQARQGAQGGTQPTSGMGYPPTGLIGSERALMAGYGAGLQHLMGGYGAARGDILGGLGAGLQNLGMGLRSGNQAYAQGARALRDAQGNIDGYFDRGIGAGNQFFNQGADAGNAAFNQGVAGLSGFIPGGLQAHNRQAALSGAMGSDAQAQAMQGFMESPYMAHLREQGERGVTRNAAALGGLGGGNVMKELSRFTTGLAAQDFGNQFNRLGQVAGQGLQAAGQVGQLRGQQGMMNANLRSQQGAMNANLRGQQAGLQGNMANALSGLYSNMGNFRGNMASNMANLNQAAGSQLGNMGMQTGMFGANMAQNLGSQLSQGRTNAGNLIAANMANTSSDLANLIDQQGRGLSDITNMTGTQLVSMLTQAGLTNAQIEQILAQSLAGANQAASGHMAGVSHNPGVQGDILGNAGLIASGIGNMNWGGLSGGGGTNTNNGTPYNVPDQYWQG